MNNEISDKERAQMALDQVVPGLTCKPLDLTCVNLEQRLQGIYMLVSCDRVVYVGQSANIIQRMTCYVEERRVARTANRNQMRSPKIWDGVLIVEVDDANINLVEKTLTELFWPKYNGSRWTANAAFPSPDYAVHGRVKNRP